MKISINPHQALQIESFEEFRTLNSAVERYHGEEHELTQHLREVGRTRFDYRNGRFTPETIQNTDEVSFASVALDSLERLASSDSRDFAPVAAFMLEHSEVFVDPLEVVELSESVPAFRDPVIASR